MIMTDELIEEAANLTMKCGPVIALTGAGISVESGIPDFRGNSGLWTVYDPAEYATIDAFISNPVKVWKMLQEMDRLVLNAKPNRAHTGLARLERLGFLDYVITQNVDNLHQAGGSEHVIEYHGNSMTLSCMYCEKRYRRDELGDRMPPLCECGKILKPDIVFFGEAIPPNALELSVSLASSAGVLMVIGTSATVSPANCIPDTASRYGAKVIEINLEKTQLTNRVTNIFIKGEAGDILNRLVKRIEEKIAEA